MNASFLMIAAILVRNPFWPIGYEGEREEISPDVRVKAKAPPPPKPGNALQAAKSQQLPTQKEMELKKEQERQRELQRKKEIERLKEMERAAAPNWDAAIKTLRIGGTMRAKKPDGTTESCVYINGKVYVDNDEVSADHNGRAYTWRVTGLTESRILKLDRVSTRRLENSSTKGNKK